MNISTLEKKLMQELEIESVDNLELDTDIVLLEEWDSMNTLVLINFIKVNFNLNITVDEIGNSFSVKDLILFIENNSDYKII